MVWSLVGQCMSWKFYFLTYHFSMWFDYNDKISKIIDRGMCQLPRPNARLHHRELILEHYLFSFDYPIVHTNGIDTLLWDGLVATKVKTRNIWNSIRNKGDLFSWNQVVWHGLRVNRYAQHQWLSCHDRINTLAKLYRFGISTSQQCFLCIWARKTNNHLFIHCSFNRWILGHLMSNLELSVTWDTWLAFRELDCFRWQT